MSGKVIYKYTIRVDDEWMHVPQGRILRAFVTRATIGIEPGVIQFWVEHLRDHLRDPDITMRIRVVGTGHPYDADLMAVGTVFDGPFVWHLLTDWVAP